MDPASVGSNKYLRPEKVRTFISFVHPMLRIHLFLGDYSFHLLVGTTKVADRFGTRSVSTLTTASGLHSVTIGYTFASPSAGTFLIPAIHILQ